MKFINVVKNRIIEFKQSWIYRNKGPLILIITPLLLYYNWYKLEFRKIDILDKFEIQSVYETPEEYLRKIDKLATDYEGHKDEYPINLEKETKKEEIRKKEEEYDDLSLVIPPFILDKIGPLAKVLKYEACLENNNIIYVENNKIEGGFIKPSEAGAIGIKQQDRDIDWYAEVGREDCKDVNKYNLLTASTTVEYRYLLITDIGPDDTKSMLKGEEFMVYTKSFRIDPVQSRFNIKLKFWSNWWLYFIILIIWSPIFFQSKKIFDYIFSKKIE